jgi:hypothetical protein
MLAVRPFADRAGAAERQLHLAIGDDYIAPSDGAAVIGK